MHSNPNNRQRFCKCGRIYSGVYEFNKHQGNNAKFFVKYMTKNTGSFSFNSNSVMKDLVDTVDKLIPPDVFKNKRIHDKTDFEPSKSCKIDDRDMQPLVLVDEINAAQVLGIKEAGDVGISDAVDQGSPTCDLTHDTEDDTKVDANIEDTIELMDITISDSNFAVPISSDQDRYDSAQLGSSSPPSSMLPVDEVQPPSPIMQELQALCVQFQSFSSSFCNLINEVSVITDDQFQQSILVCNQLMAALNNILTKETVG